MLEHHLYGNSIGVKTALVDCCEKSTCNPRLPADCLVRAVLTGGQVNNGLLEVKEEGRTGFSEGW